MAIVALVLVSLASFVLIRRGKANDDSAARCAVVRSEEKLQQSLNKQATGKPGAIAFLGDSYTAGRGATSVSGSYAVDFGKLTDRPVLLFGSAGSGFIAEGACGTDHFETRVDDVVAAAPAVVIVQGGLNDQSDDPKAVGAAADVVLDELRAGLPGSRLILFGPVDPVGGDHEVAAIDTELAQVAESNGIAYISALDWITDDNRELIGPDHIHPTDQGHRYLAQRLDQEVKPLLPN